MRLNVYLSAYQTPSLYCLSLSSFSTLSELFQLNLSLLTSLLLSLSHPLTSFSHHCLSFLPFPIYPRTAMSMHNPILQPDLPSLFLSSSSQIYLLYSLFLSLSLSL